jgi:thiol-disulfide isomerase/thioredoxin
MESDTRMTGHWKRRASKGRVISIPFVAEYGAKSRFQPETSTTAALAPKWEVTFSPGIMNDESKAIGLFYALPDGNIGGSFATETGDYRYLEGDFDGTTLRLSCFDGCHVYLFTAMLSGGMLHGTFYSGTTHKETWTAKPNPTFELRDPDQLTFLKPGFDSLDFTFLSLEGKPVSLHDYRGKPVVVQLMGSWCPNCLDEARYFSQLYKRYHPQGLEMIAVAFEYVADPVVAAIPVQRHKDRLGCEYTFCLAGTTPDKAIEALPMLNHIMSFPTSIFIDKEGKIRRIHTGFYGPGTGAYYDAFTRKTEALVEQMLR